MSAAPFKDKMRTLAFSCFLLLFAGCQTAQQKRLDLLRDRVEKLRPLSTYKSTWCRVDAQLTQPAQARYREMFPAETTGEVLPFTWKAREGSCEVTALKASPVTKNYQGFLETALCTLMQTHWVNSPFDELPFAPERLDDRDERVHLALTDEKNALGLYLDRRNFLVETHTRGRGTLTAHYAQTDDGRWLPDRLEQHLGPTEIVLDGFEWETVPLNGRLMPHSVWLSAGEEHPFRHSQLMFSECRDL